MASQDNFENLKIYFVIPAKYKTEDECSEEMWEVYNMCLQNEFQIEWIEELQCDKLDTQKTDVFVMEDFQGAIFDKLTTSKCLIIGPRCLLNCFLSGEPIPAGNSPVFTTSMRGTIVTTSGLDAEAKKHIKKKVEYMGGTFTKQLHSSVTHLISDSVMSVKYEKAVEQGIPVLTDHWINAIWEANLTEFVKVDDPRFNQYKCPVFMNLIVTSTNLSKQEKETAKKLINENGGTFMGALDGSVVKVVLAPPNCRLTDKLKYAKKNNIACLDLEWVSKSVNAGYALPFEEYLVLSTKDCSTPEKSQFPLLNCSTISAISEPTPANNIIEETLAMTMNSTGIPNASLSDRQSLPSYVSKLDKLDIREAKLAGPFLDGCNIYLTGFPPNHRDKINRILNAGGATRLNDISDTVTHAIVGDPNKASNELKIMQARGINPHIVNLDWLEESLRLQRPALEEHFIDKKKRSTNHQTAEPPSPLSKKNLQMLQRPKRPPVPQFNIDAEPTDCQDEGEEEASLVQQYLRKTTDEDKEVLPRDDTTLKGETRNSSTSNSTSSKAKGEVTTTDVGNDSAVPYSQSTIGDKIFDGLTFLVNGFDEDEFLITKQNINALGGRLVLNSFSGVPDYGVVPLLGTVLKHTVDEIVTNLFIEDCIDQEKVVEITYCHRPLSLPTNAKPLKGLVISTSTYAGIERIYLTQVVTALGAIYQDTFARTTNEERNLLGSTHLLCPLPKGSKYKAAVKWKLPAVTADWLRACVNEIRWVDETSYLVGETMAPERPAEVSQNTSRMSPPAARTILTPRKRLSKGPGTPGFDTPLVNKRLSLAMGNTTQSPCQVTTPVTPYGRIFKDNPSPQTRKEWLQWIESFPDMKVEEPPPKRRHPSTPIEDIIDEFWKKVQEPIPSPLTSNDGKTVTEADTSKTTRKTSHEDSRLGDSKEENVPEDEQAIRRRLSFSDDSASSKQAIDLQIEQLEQVLQATRSTAESRYSLSGNAKVYNDRTPMERIDKSMLKDSQADTVGWEDPVNERRMSYKPSENVEETIAKQRKWKFMLTGVKDRTKYETMIKKLNGEVSTEANYDSTATHFLCTKPSRNEKMLSSIAAGKWVLHCSYLDECYEAGRFMDEEKYEWGNPLSRNVIPEQTGETEKAVAAAAYRWRLKLQREPGGAFQEIVAMLLVPKERYDQFARLIKAGNGTVVQAKPPYDSSPGGRKITHCFIQLKQLNQPVEWAMLASKGILCFQPQYLSDYLTATEPLNPRESVIPEFKKYLALLPK